MTCTFDTYVEWLGKGCGIRECVAMLGNVHYCALRHVHNGVFRVGRERHVGLATEHLARADHYNSKKATIWTG